VSPFPIFLIIAFLVLRLSFRWRWRTIILASIGIALAGDFIVDMLIALRAQ
jgi:hypothetical protein